VNLSSLLQGVELTDDLVDELSSKLVRTLKLLDAASYTMLAVGLLLVLGASGMMYRDHRRRKSMGRVTPPGFVVSATS